MHPKFLSLAIVAMLNTSVLPFAQAEACHTLNGDGGVIAGSFEAMRSKLTRTQVRNMLVNPEQTHGNDKIPDFSHLAEKDIETLVNFIQPKP